MGKKGNARNSANTSYIIIRLTPLTDILGYRYGREATELAKRYAKVGWFPEDMVEHIDRIFERDAYGRPIIYFVHLRAVLRRGLSILESRGKIKTKEKEFILRNLWIHHVREVEKNVCVEENGKKVTKKVTDYEVLPFRVQYFYFKDNPIIIERTIFSKEGQTLMVTEVITPPNEAIFALEAPSKYIPIILEALQIAGLEVGMFSQGRMGFGRFTIEAIKII